MAAGGQNIETEAMKKSGSYPEEQMHAVAYRDEESEETYEGALSFGGGRWAHLSFKNNAPATLVEGERIDQITVQSESGQGFTLCECQMSGSVLYANFVFEADIGAPEFDEIT